MKKLLILGAGYGGLAVAQKFISLSRGKSQWQITLVDQRDYHLIQVRIHEVAANSIPADKVRIPFSELLQDSSLKFVKASIEKIDPVGKKVLTSDGELFYDRLVIALGSEPAYRNIKGLEEHAFNMKSLEDALHFREAVIDAFEEATRPEAAPLKTPDERLTFVIGGAGLTGTELAAEMVDFCRELVNRIPKAQNAYRIVLLEAAPQILPQLNTEYGEYVKAELQQRGVSVLTNAIIERVEARSAYFKGGKLLRGRLFCWAGGIKAPAVLQESGFEVGKEGRLPVDQYLRLQQYPEIFVVGDCALIPDQRTGLNVPQTGQYAEREGDFVGENLWDEERGLRQRRYIPFSLGLAISLGRSEALAITGPIRLTGVPGRLAKNVSYDNYEWNIRSKPKLLKSL